MAKSETSPATFDRDAPPARLPDFHPAQKIEGEKFNYKMSKSVRDFENARVFLVWQLDGEAKERKKELECKVQFKNIEKYARSLKNEIHVLEGLRSYQAALPNIVHLRDKGETEDLIYVFLPHHTCDLDRLYKLHGKFTPQEAYKLCHGCVTALSQFHSVDLVHGCVRMASFVMGPNEEVKLTDFGFTQNNPTSDGPATDCLLYYPSNSYSPRAVYEKKTLCFRDDAESLLYCLMYLFKRNAFPWRSLARSKLEHKMKSKFFITPEDVITGGNPAPAFLKMVAYINSMKRTQEIDYDLIFSILRTVAEEMDVKEEEARQRIYGFGANRRSREYTCTSKDSRENSVEEPLPGVGRRQPSYTTSPVRENNSKVLGEKAGKSVASKDTKAVKANNKTITTPVKKRESSDAKKPSEPESADPKKVSGGPKKATK